MKLLRRLASLASLPLLLAACAAGSHLRAEAPGVVGPGAVVDQIVAAHPTSAPHLISVAHFDRRLAIERLDVPRDPGLAPYGRLLQVSRQILSTTIAGQHVVIVFPVRSRHTAILFEHGSGETADLDVDVPPSAPTIARLVSAGYTWAESDAGFNNWGDRASLDDDLAVARWLRAHGDPTIDIGGDSMGGLDATQLIPMIHPQAVFELFPVCDERTVVDEFGLLMQRADAPLRRLSPVAMHDVRGLPMLFTASPQDTLVAKATNADVCAREARAAGARVREVTTRGEHGNASNWQASRLVTFLDRAAGGAAARRRPGHAQNRELRRHFDGRRTPGAPAPRFWPT